MKDKDRCNHYGGLTRAADSIADCTNGNHYWECSECGQEFVERERLTDAASKADPGQRKAEVEITGIFVPRERSSFSPAPFGSRKP